MMKMTLGKSARATFQHRPNIISAAIHGYFSVNLGPDCGRGRCLRLASDIGLPPQAASLDHLVGAQQERIGDCKPDCFCGFEVDDQFELGRLLHRQIGGSCALEN